MIICYRHFSKEGAVHSAPLDSYLYFFFLSTNNKVNSLKKKSHFIAKYKNLKLNCASL